MTSRLMETTRDLAARAMFDIQQKAGVAWNSAGVSEGVIRQILYIDWKGANFSKLIKTTDGYWALREKGIEMSSHALSRYYDTGCNPDSALSVDGFAALYRRGANYTQGKDGRNVYFNGQHDIIENPENHVIVSFIYRRTVKDT